MIFRLAFILLEISILKQGCLTQVCTTTETQGNIRTRLCVFNFPACELLCLKRNHFVEYYARKALKEVLPRGCEACGNNGPFMSTSMSL